jgi:hypothetical protein
MRHCFQYTSPADIGIENYNPTVFKMAVLAELIKSQSGIKATKINRIKKPIYTYSDIGEWQSNLPYEQVCDAILLSGEFKVLRNCYQSAFNEYVLLSHSEDWKIRYDNAPFRYMVGQCYTFGESEFHANGGLGTKIHHAWVEVDTHIDGKEITMVIDESNNRSMICEAHTFYKQWKVHSLNDFSLVVDNAIKEVFKKFPKKHHEAQIKKLNVFQILDIKKIIQVIDEDTVKQHGGILSADYIECMMGASVMEYCLAN